MRKNNPLEVLKPFSQSGLSLLYDASKPLTSEVDGNGSIGGTALRNYLIGDLDYSRQLAFQQREFDFERQMSNTAYQRGVVDMERAGLNPYLAYSSGGASSPSGGAVPSVRGSSNGVGAIISGLASLAGKAISGAFRGYESALEMEHKEDLLHERFAHQLRLQDRKNTYSTEKLFFDKKGNFAGSESSWKRSK